MLPAAELVLLCDERGAILEAGGPWLEGPRPAPARTGGSCAAAPDEALAAVPVTLLGWVSEAGAAQALDFLLALREDGTAFGHWIPLTGAGSVSISLAFAGVASGEQMWVIAASSESNLRAACRQWSEDASALSPRPPRPVRRRLEWLAGSGEALAGAVAASDGGPASDGADVVSADRGAATKAGSSPTTGAARALAALIRRAGVALFRDPLSREQARLAAAIVRKTELLAGLVGAPPGGDGETTAADEPSKLDGLLQEAVAVHAELASERGVTIDLVLAAHQPRPSRPVAEYEIAVDLLLAAAVELARSGERVELEAGAGRRALRLIARLSGSAEIDTGELLAPVARQLAALGGSLHHTAERGRADRVAIEIVADLPAGDPAARRAR